MARSDWHEIVPGLIWRKSQDINKVREVIKRKNDDHYFLFVDLDEIGDDWDSPQAAMDYADTHYPMEPKP
jgi:hypothetical protein